MISISIIITVIIAITLIRLERAGARHPAGRDVGAVRRRSGLEFCSSEMYVSLEG